MTETEPTSSRYLSRGGWLFPHPPRQVQKDILEFVADRPNEKNFVIHAPCGTGKSPVTIAIANKDGGAIMTPHKMLQDQYLRDWPSVSVIKGKSNYTCMHAQNMTCEHGGALGCKSRQCNYTVAKQLFLSSRIGIANYDWLLKYLQMSSEPISHDWLLFDEAHEFEGKLIDIATLEITEKFCDAYDIRFEVPQSQRSAEYYVEQFFQKLKGIASILRAQISNMGENVDQNIVRRALELEKMESALNLYLSRKGAEEWVYTSGKDRISFKPLFASKLFGDYIAPLGKRHLFTSATLGPPQLLKQWIGIDSYSEFSTPSPFPKENRKMFFIPTAYVTFKNLDVSMSKVIVVIKKILKKFATSKGIIHCNSFKLGEMIHSMLGDPRILFHHRDTTREEILDRHIRSPDPTVILSPSMTEGVDLKGDLSRFTVFPKVPYPYLGDEWVVRRKDVDPKWYAWQVAKTIMQGMGRSVRSEDDYATGYILDSCFERFYSENSWMLPPWFKGGFCE